MEDDEDDEDDVMDMELILIQSAVLVPLGCRLRGAAGGSMGESVAGGEGVRREIVTLLYSVSRPANADEDCCSWSHVIKLLEREDMEPLDSDRVEEGGVSMPTSAA